ncbi:hypothetical protein PG993_015273 [Apiospora rasikravindrae]|uniref:Uncharacterized protein n=1 Tax=Apiospora rasikravindrae TaxID=990691 RepID=A0ABR1RQ29_9PEZI
MTPSSRIARTQTSPKEETSLGLQRLAETCPEFARLDLIEQLSEKTPATASGSGGLKLSWPKANNTRRAVVAKTVTSSVPSRGTHSTSTPGAHMINVTCGDIAVHYRYTGSGPRGSKSPANTYPALHVPTVYNLQSLDTGNQDLFEYCGYTLLPPFVFSLSTSGASAQETIHIPRADHRQTTVDSVASRSLSTFGQDPVQLGQLLLRIAFGGDATSFGPAVQQSLLAFSSAHRHGAHSRGNEHKIAALKALADISGCKIGVTEAVQHVAAGMLLCSYEMQHSTCTTGHWLSYLIGIQDIIRIIGLDTIHHDPELTMLLDWVYYYSVLARFSRQHWHRKEFVGVQLAPMRRHREVSSTATPHLAYLGLLSEMCDGAIAPVRRMESNGGSEDHRNYLAILDWKIRNLPVTVDCDLGADSESKLELYRLAMLIYLNRASENALNQATKTQQRVDQGVSILSRLRFCDQQFPVFIMGCEARSDGEREAVLGLIQRTEEHGTCREFNHVRLLLGSLWAQNDLAFGRDLKYWDQLSDAMSRCVVLPTFV